MDLRPTPAAPNRPMPKHPLSLLLSAVLLCAAAPAHASLLRMWKQPAPPVTEEPAPAPAAPASPVDAELFPQYEGLLPAIGFWKQVFGEYSEHQSALHPAQYPHKVLEVLDFRGEAAGLHPYALAPLKAREEERAKKRLIAVLRGVHDRRHAPETLNDEERGLFERFADIDDDNRFLLAADTLRAQRGLRERTEQALEVSGKYLPEMERIFRDYQLPAALTRLPLVESSFNVEAYSKVGAAGLWQFMPSSARAYMRLNEVVDDRRDPWTSTDAAARHLRDDYARLGSWPLAITAYNHGRSGVARALEQVNGTTLMDLIERYRHPRFGFASRNFYAEFLAAVEVEQAHLLAGQLQKREPLSYEIVETRHYLPYETLKRLCGADDELFRKLNPAYRPEVIEGKLYVPPGHLIRVPAGSAKTFEVAYASLGHSEKFSSQRDFYLLHRVRKGEVLGQIARQYRVSTAAILSANGLRDPRRLQINQVLRIPPHTESRPGPISVAIGESKPQQTLAQQRAQAGARQHKVQAGQTLTGIARRYDVSLQELREANGLIGSSLIKPGMRLEIPGR